MNALRFLLRWPWHPNGDPLAWTAAKYPRWFRFLTYPYVFLRMWQINYFRRADARYFAHWFWLDAGSID
jgi:hypothetical protein